MARITIKSLQEEIETLKSINTYQSNQIKKLNTEIENFKDKGNIVSNTEFNALSKELKEQKLITNEYKKLYENLISKHKEERKKYILEIKNLKEKIDSSETKLNERNAGRKAYDNKEVIEVIYYLYLDGKSLQGIADELNNTEVRTNRGKEWSKSTIRFILLNYKNVTNGFIEKDIFDSAVKLLTDNRK